MSSDQPSTAKPVHRLRVGLLSVLQTVLVVLIFIAGNFLSSQHYRPFDLSDTLSFTLAPSTARYLESEALTGRDSEIRMIVAFRADSPFYDRIRPIADEYQRLADGHLQLMLVDPIRAHDSAESIAAEYGIVFNQDLVIIDARTQAERDEPGGSKASPHVHVVKLEDMVVYETDAQGQRRVRGFLGEDALRAGLVAAVEGKPRRMWVLADKSDLTAETYEGVWQIFSANLISQNIIPERVRIAGAERIPDDVSAVAILAPAYDLTTTELGVLEEYWSRPKSALMITTGDKDVPPRLRAFLRKHGVTPRSDRVISIKHETVQTAVPATFTSGMDFTRDLWEKTTLLEGVTRSLDVREGAEDLLNQRIQPYSLLESAPDFWADTRFPAEIVDFDEREDRAGPIPLAAAVIRGTATDQRFADDTSRMIVIANTAMLSPDHIRQANLDFFASAANWLVGRDILAGQGPRNLRLYKLPLLEPQVAFINRVNLLFLPAFLVLIGAIVWSSRRA